MRIGLLEDLTDNLAPRLPPALLLLAMLLGPAPLAAELQTARASGNHSVTTPQPWLKRQPLQARVMSKVGTVQLTSGASGQNTPLQEGTLISAGDEILSASGTATVELARGSDVRISPNSRLIFNRLIRYGEDGTVDARLRLDRGELHTRVAPLVEGGARLEIETPLAMAAVRGTAFTLRASPGSAGLRVIEGDVDFGRPGKTRRISAGFGASVSSTRNADVSIRPLPPAPTINPLPPKLTRLPGTMTWRESRAPMHRLDIFEADSGRWLESHELTGTGFDIGRLDNGRYAAHLAALDTGGRAGMPGVVRFEVDLQAKAATLRSPSNGDTVNEDRPEFRWHFNGENEMARVEIAEDKDFRRRIATSEWAHKATASLPRTLGPGKYYWRVVTQTGGSSVATTESRQFVVNGSLPPVRIVSVNYIDGQVRIGWEKVNTATDYRLQLSEEPGFNNIIREARLAETTAALKLIPGRRYFVRLKALSDGPLQSRWGPGRELYLE